MFPSGLPLLVMRIAASAFGGIVLPVALAIVAVAYTGVTRATALGMAYAALGASTAITPALLIAVTPTIGRWPSFLLAAAALALAAFVVLRNVPDTPPSGLASAPDRAARNLGVRSFGAHRRAHRIPRELGIDHPDRAHRRRRSLWSRSSSCASDADQRIPDDAAIDVRPATVAHLRGRDPRHCADGAAARAAALLPDQPAVQPAAGDDRVGALHHRV